MAAKEFLPRDESFSTRAIQTRYDPCQWDSWCVTTPIVMSTTFQQKSPADPLKYVYARSSNPTRDVLEDIVASLELGKYGLCFSSGLGCVCAVSHLLKAGDHLLAMGDVYGGVYRMFNQILPDTGIKIDFMDIEDLPKIQPLIRNNTKMIWLETPTNPLLKYVDIAKVAEIAHEHDILLVVDNTFLTPYFQKPLDFGADIVVHSLTKYINGHSDVIMGAVVVNDKQLHERLKFIQNGYGIIPSPFDCYLVIRSLKTLVVRLKQHMSSSLRIAEFLENHSVVEYVIHPGLKSHPQQEIAKKQTSGWSGMLAFYVKGGLKETKLLISRLKLFTLAESLGGYESLIEIPSIMTHAAVPLEEKKKLQLTDNLIRVSVGLEETEDLISDLKQGLDFVAESTKCNGVPRILND